MRRLPVEPHLTADQARARHRACRHPVETLRWHAIWLLLRTDPPRSPAQVAEVVGLSAVTVRDILRRWNERGPAGLADRRAGNGARPKLSDDRRAALFASLKRRPPDGGLRTGPKVARFVGDRWGVAVRPQTGWQWLRDLGFSLQVPRPSHPRAADAAARARWKKTCASGCGGCGGRTPPSGWRSGRRTRPASG
jgi:transposase